MDVVKKDVERNRIKTGLIKYLVTVLQTLTAALVAAGFYMRGPRKEEEEQTEHNERGESSRNH